MVVREVALPVCGFRQNAEAEKPSYHQHTEEKQKAKIIGSGLSRIKLTITPYDLFNYIFPLAEGDIHYYVNTSHMLNVELFHDRGVNLLLDTKGGSSKRDPPLDQFSEEIVYILYRR